VLNKDVRYLSRGNLVSARTNIGFGEKENGEASPNDVKAFSFASAFSEDLRPIQPFIQCI
jgi:hypothetical protein